MVHNTENSLEFTVLQDLVQKLIGEDYSMGPPPCHVQGQQFFIPNKHTFQVTMCSPIICTSTQHSF
jgi:hypothetical protein